MMHEYSFNSRIRQNVVIVLLVISAILSVAYYFAALKWKCLTLPQWVDGPSLLALYGVLAYAFENFLWKVNWFQNWVMPDLNGTWVGLIKSSYNGGTDIGCTLIIRQTWTKISCTLETDNSRSYSTQAGVVRVDGRETELNWLYINEPKNSSEKKMQMHHGISRARIMGDTLICEYYNCAKERQTYGHIEFTKRK